MDDPLVQDWAAPAALRSFGAPLSPADDAGRLALLALGEGAEILAQGARAVFGSALDEALVVSTPTSVGGARSREVLVAGAGSGDPHGLDAGRRVMELVGSLGRRDRLLVLLSPPGTELLAAPVPDVSPGALAEALALLGAAGWSRSAKAPVRSRLDRLQAGGLVRACGPASILALVVPGNGGDDDPRGGLAEALTGVPEGARTVEIALRRAGLWDDLSAEVRAALAREERLEPAEALQAPTVEMRVLDGGPRGLPAALSRARASGLSAVVLTDDLRGTPDAAGRGLARVGRALQDGLADLRPPACALAAGRLSGGVDRHATVMEAARAALVGREGIVVRAWPDPAGGADLMAVLVAPAP